jgi:single-strand DNA-binding protein
MASLNRVVLIGNLTKDPEVKYRPDGTAVTDLRLAVNETFRNRQTGESVEKTCFVDVVVWARQAENCGKYLSKGSPVLVEGGLQMDEWEAQDGGKRSRLRVRARNVQFLSAARATRSSAMGRRAAGRRAAGGSRRWMWRIARARRQMRPAPTTKTCRSERANR